MLTDALVEHILERLPNLTIGVLGDLFLDRYLDVDASLTESSLETGLDAYQIVRVRSYPGAAGTIINNLVALGVGRVVPIAAIGDDGEGYELLQSLRALPGVSRESILVSPEIRTPTYMKPMLQELGKPARELNRFDIKNRTPLPADLERQLIEHLPRTWPQLDGLVVLDQVSEPECGVVTTSVREQLATQARLDPEKFVLADSRERIGLFSALAIKPNRRECLRAVGREPEAIEAAVRELARRTGRPVFCTAGEQGIWLADEHGGRRIPGYQVAGPIDVVGAGDSTSAGILCAVASGTTLDEAAAFGNLVASITIQQLGTTGTASPAQVRQQWQAVQDSPRTAYAD